MMGQTTLEQTKTVLLTSRLLPQLIYSKRVYFLGTANLENRLRVMHIFLSALCTLLITNLTLGLEQYSSDTCPASVGYLRR